VFRGCPITLSGQQQSHRESHYFIAMLLLRCSSHQPIASRTPIDSARHVETSGKLNISFRKVQRCLSARSSGHRTDDAIQFPIASRAGDLSTIHNLRSASDSSAGDSEALKHAARVGRLDTVDTVLDSEGSDVFACQWELLMDSVHAGHTSVVKRLLHTFVATGLGDDSEMYTEAFIESVHCGHKDIAKLLLPLAVVPQSYACNPIYNAASWERSRDILIALQAGESLLAR
jgi:hypothetical protein